MKVLKILGGVCCLILLVPSLIFAQAPERANLIEGAKKEGEVNVSRHKRQSYRNKARPEHNRAVVEAGNEQQAKGSQEYQPGDDDPRAIHGWRR